MLYTVPGPLFVIKGVCHRRVFRAIDRDIYKGRRTEQVK